MRFSTLFTALAVVATGVTATDSSSSSTSVIGLTAANDYGAPIPPWETGSSPGWYYGQGTPPSGLESLADTLICELLELLFPLCLQCPKPPPKPPSTPEYTLTFYNQTCATQDASYMTYGLVDTVADCETMCDTVPGCTFVNTYHDVNGKGGSTQLTCSLFSTCLTAASNDNCGGQTQPNGSVDFIINSDGYCKKTPTA
ncbi:hypothetical protein DFH07DRAFT_1067921 [Mycena maculata]|uniref:Apple domain-containing protein n=1 Tax=Mycena maculata TaxID=230809 RepID=A0AAD7HER4_9AGAR|nr:hypothetical protein DFH07DRAFT_1067921 [Mycena maculata]